MNLLNFSIYPIFHSTGISLNMTRLPLEIDIDTPAGVDEWEKFIVDPP